MLEKYKVPMPNQNLSEQEVREYLAYFKWADANLRPQGARQPQPAAEGTAMPPGKSLSAPGHASEGSARQSPPDADRRPGAGAPR
jgi:hypothetical protein